MQTVTQLIKAVGTGYNAPLGGRAFIVQSCDAGNSLTITLTDRSGKQYTAVGVGPGFKAVPRMGFDRVAITTNADANVSFIVSDGDVDLQNNQVNVVVANSAAAPVPVTIAGGSVNVTASNITVANTVANPVPVELHTSDITLPVSLSSLPALPAGSNSIGTVNIGNSAAAPVPVYDAYQAPVTAAWNSGTAANTSLTLNTQGYDTVIVTVAPSGTITAGAVTFEAYDGTNWVSVKAPRTDSYQTDSTFALAAAGTHSWQLPVAGYPQVRARLSTAIAGTGTANLVAIASSAPDVSLVTVGLDPSQPLPAGTNTLGSVGITGALPAGSNNIGVITDNTMQARSLAGQSFGGFCIAVPASGQYSRFQLWNPAGSGVNLYVLQVQPNISADASVYLASSTTQLATFAQKGQNKLMTGAQSKAGIYYDTTATPPAGPYLGLASPSGASQGQAVYPAADPIIVPPGYGLLVTVNLTNVQLYGAFEWYEQ